MYANKHTRLQKKSNWTYKSTSALIRVLRVVVIIHPSWNIHLLKILFISGNILWPDTMVNKRSWHQIKDPVKKRPPVSVSSSSSKPAQQVENKWVFIHYLYKIYVHFVIFFYIFDLFVLRYSHSFKTKMSAIGKIFGNSAIMVIWYMGNHISNIREN